MEPRAGTRPGGHPCDTAVITRSGDAGYDPEVERSYGLGCFRFVANAHRRAIARSSEMTGNYCAPCSSPTTAGDPRARRRSSDWADRTPAAAVTAARPADVALSGDEPRRGASEDPALDRVRALASRATDRQATPSRPRRSRPTRGAPAPPRARPPASRHRDGRPPGQLGGPRAAHRHPAPGEPPGAAAAG